MTSLCRDLTSDQEKLPKNTFLKLSRGKKWILTLGSGLSWINSSAPQLGHIYRNETRSIQSGMNAVSPDHIRFLPVSLPVTSDDTHLYTSSWTKLRGPGKMTSNIALTYVLTDCTLTLVTSEWRIRESVPPCITILLENQPDKRAPERWM